jgi:hypothetical protein
MQTQCNAEQLQFSCVERQSFELLDEAGVCITGVHGDSPYSTMHPTDRRGRNPQAKIGY